MNTTTLERLVDLTPAAPPSGGTSRSRVGDVLLAVMAISVILAIYGAVAASAPVLLTAGSVAASVGLAFGLFTPVISNDR